MKRFCDRKWFVDAAAGFKTAIHELGLPFHEWKAAFRICAFPFVEKIGAVNLRPRIRTSLIRAKGAGNSSEYHLGWTKVDRIFPARNPNKILQPAQLAIGCSPIEKHSVVPWITKRITGAAATVLDAENQLRVPWHGHDPGNLGANAAQTVRPKQTAVDNWRVRKIPGMRMGRINSAECGEELSGFQLQIERQTGRLQERFLDFDFGLVVVVELENNVGETFEVRIDRAVEGELNVARVESTLLRIVVADFDVIEIARARTGEREQPIERDVHVIFPTAADRDRLGQ